MDISSQDYLPSDTSAIIGNPTLDGAAEGTTPRRRDEMVGPSGLRATVASALSGAIAAVMGLIPHLLHHLSLFAGAALITGAAGNLLFGALGLILSIPLLRRLHRRYSTWKAPAAAVSVFALMFALSAFVVGPALTDGGDGSSKPGRPSPTDTVSPEEHQNHHSE